MSKRRAEDAGEAPAAQRMRRIPYEEIVVATEAFSEHIGEGYHGSVFKGRLQEQVVAVKRLKRHSVLDYDEFVKEIEVWKACEHPNVVGFVGHSCGNDVPGDAPAAALARDEDDEAMGRDAEHDYLCLVFEFVANGNLAQVLCSEALDWAQRMRIAAGVAEAIGYLHERRIVHRDIKPENVLLDHAMVPKLSDFGLVRIVPERTDSSGTFVVTYKGGTDFYVAPEYSSKRRLSFKCDVYSFGVVLLELILGRRIMDEDRKRSNNEACRWPFDLIDPDVEDVVQTWKELRNDAIVWPPDHVARATISVVKRCLHDTFLSRPTISDVISLLKAIPDPSRMAAPAPAPASTAAASEDATVQPEPTLCPKRTALLGLVRKLADDTRVLSPDLQALALTLSENHHENWALQKKRAGYRYGEDSEEHKADHLLKPLEDLPKRDAKKCIAPVVHSLVQLLSDGINILPPSSGSALAPLVARRPTYDASGTFVPTPIDVAGIQLNRQEEDIALELAKYSHSQWHFLRIRAGWRHAAKRDSHNRTHPELLPWSLLPAERQQGNIDQARGMLCVMKKLGYRVQERSHWERALDRS